MFSGVRERQRRRGGGGVSQKATAKSETCEINLHVRGGRLVESGSAKGEGGTGWPRGAGGAVGLATAAAAAAARARDASAT